MLLKEKIRSISVLLHAGSILPALRTAAYSISGGLQLVHFSAQVVDACDAGCHLG